MEAKSKLITKQRIPFIGIATVIALNCIIGAEDDNKKQTSIPLLVEPVPIILPIPRPSLAKEEYCTRTNYPAASPSSSTTPGEIIDGPLPLHCLEPNCGLGVYSKRENQDVIERCSYCGSVKPEKA